MRGYGVTRKLTKESGEETTGALVEGAGIPHRARAGIKAPGRNDGGVMGAWPEKQPNVGTKCRSQSDEIAKGPP